jgi:hypothetical protein
MEVSKIHLSASEIELVTNRDIILTKNIVMNKMQNLLEQVQLNQIKFVNDNHLNTIEAFSIHPKISRGENYLGLPYLILDYPRISHPDNFLFIRTMFWWGNFFSSTLQTGQKNKEKLLKNMDRNMNSLVKHYYIGINPDPWHHHFEEKNYLPIVSFDSIKKIYDQNPEYLKIAGKWPLSKWPVADTILFDSWKFLLKINGLIP